jgi:hypothetical protein
MDSIYSNLNYTCSRMLNTPMKIRREVVYNILIEFGLPMELVRLIKMFLNEKKTSWPESTSELSDGATAACRRNLVSRGQRDRSLRPYSLFSRPELLLFLPSSSSIVLKNLSGPRSRPIT